MKTQTVKTYTEKQGNILITITTKNGEIATLTLRIERHPKQIYAHDLTFQVSGKNSILARLNDLTEIIEHLYDYLENDGVDTQDFDPDFGTDKLLGDELEDTYGISSAEK